MHQNSQHIARHACRQVLVPSKPSMALAYGARKMEALVEHLHSTDNMIVSEALGNLAIELKLRANAIHALKSTDVVEILTTLVSLGSMRIIVVECLAHLAQTLEGKRQIARSKTLGTILKAFTTIDIRKLKRGVYAVVEAIAQWGEGATAAIEAGYIEALASELKKVSSNPVGLCAAARILYLLCKNGKGGSGIDTAISNGVVETCIKLIGIHPQVAVREEAAVLLDTITFHAGGKERARGHEDIVAVLCKVIRSVDPESGVMGSASLRASAASILTNVCSSAGHKKAACKNNTLGYLSSMIRIECDIDEKLAGLRALSVLADLPEVREQCRESVTLDHIRELINSTAHDGNLDREESKETDLVASTAERALQHMLWTP